MKKILFLINTLGGGGAEKVLVDLVNLLPKERYDVSIMSILPGVHDNSVASNIKHRVILGTCNSLVRVLGMKIFCKLFPYKFFSFFFIKGKYDIIISYLEGFPTRVVAASSTKAKKVAFVHCDISVNNYWLKIYRSIEECRNEYASFDRVCFVSEKSKNSFLERIGELKNTQVLHNVINPFEILKLSNAPLNEKYQTKGLKLISVGRLVEPKSYDRLLNVVSLLNKENFNFELWILGEGPLRKDLEYQIEDQNLFNVKLLGFKNNPYKYMASADLYVCSSLTEGYSTTITEAIVLGLPVLTTQCAGMTELLLNGRYGDIVPNSLEGLYTGLKKVLTNKSHLIELKSLVQERSLHLRSNDFLSEYNNLFNSL